MVDNSLNTDRIDVLRASGCAIRSVTFERKVILRVLRGDVLYRHSTLNAAQRKSNRRRIGCVRFPISKNRNASML